MRWWGRVLSLCAAVLLVAGCDLQPVTDQMAAMDTFAVPAPAAPTEARPPDDTPDDIPHVTAEPIDLDEVGDPAAQQDDANPNEHRSLADVVTDQSRPARPAAPASERTAAPADGRTDARGAARPHADAASEVAEPPGPGGDAGPPEPAADGDAVDTAPGGAPTSSADAPRGRGDRQSARPTPARPTAPSSPPPPAAPVELSDIEQQIVDRLNEERVAAGLQPVALDADLAQGARSWATTMARGGTFEHESEGGFSENIAYGYDDAAEVHAAWMASPGHRANRMRPGLTSYGVGVRAAGTTLYFVERFR